MSEDNKVIWDEELYKKDKVAYYTKYPRSVKDELISEFIEDLKSIRTDDGGVPEFGIEILVKKWEEKLK